MLLALLWLATFEEKLFGQNIRRAWKGHDWDALNRLHEKGFIGNPVGKAKSVIVTDEGAKRSEELFRHFSANRWGSGDCGLVMTNIFPNGSKSARTFPDGRPLLRSQGKRSERLLLANLMPLCVKAARCAA
jgi:hypothetical protein